MLKSGTLIDYLVTLVLFSNFLFLMTLRYFGLSLTPYMKLRRTGTVKRLNIEHRTSNIEHRILMTLRFIDFKTSEP
jgi:hypothetical protein